VSQVASPSNSTRIRRAACSPPLRASIEHKSVLDEVGGRVGLGELIFSEHLTAKIMMHVGGMLSCGQHER
jgi:hypothetical protein